jgi:hypothetical protein
MVQHRPDGVSVTSVPTKCTQDIPAVSTPKTPLVNNKNKRKSPFEDGPQVKIMKEQVSAVVDQVEILSKIEKHLAEIKDTEKEKLEVMKGEYFA